MQLKITTGKDDYEILDSGTIISFQDESIKFQLAVDLKIIISFKTDKNIKEQKMDYNPINNHELELIMINFHNSLGIGNASPLPLATINNKKVYLNYVIYALTESSSKTVHYTWYLREEVPNV